MVVEVSFRVDEVAVRKEKELGVEGLEPPALFETFLILPVRWRVQDVEMLEEPGTIPGGWGAWLPLPVLNVDSVARAAVEAAFKSGKASYALPGLGEKVHLYRSGKQLEAVAAFTGERANAEYEGYVEAFARFHEQLSVFIREYFPELTQLTHDGWNSTD